MGGGRGVRQGAAGHTFPPRLQVAACTGPEVRCTLRCAAPAPQSAPRLQPAAQRVPEATPPLPSHLGHTRWAVGSQAVLAGQPGSACPLHPPLSAWSTRWACALRSLHGSSRVPPPGQAVWPLRRIAWQWPAQQVPEGGAGAGGRAG
jgi:hypothetical protein